MNYGRGISSARLRVGMSKRKLALLAELDPSYITHIESGKKVPSLSAVEAIAHALDIPLYLLMLLSSDDSDLEDVSSKKAAALGNALLDLVRSAAN